VSARNGPGGNSRGGPRPTDRPTAENPGEKFIQDDTPHPRQTPVWHAVADVRAVVGRGGNPRLVMLVARCPGCQQPHMHLARVPFLATVRKAGCGARYMLHALNGEAAA
jgi:hypothetical protein